MGLIPGWLVEAINDAFPKNVCLVGVALDDGFAQISPRGSVIVYDENTLAIWDRGSGRPHKGKTTEAVADGTKMTVYYRNVDFGAKGGNGLLPGGGIARFYGSAELHTEDGEVREKVLEVRTVIQTLAGNKCGIPMIPNKHICYYKDGPP